MSVYKVHVCQCQLCKLGVEHSNKLMHQQINLLMSRLDDQQRCLFAALEANRIGHGGARFLSQITGLDEATIQRGQKELVEELYNHPIDQVNYSSAEKTTMQKGVPIGTD